MRQYAHRDILSEAPPKWPAPAIICMAPRLSSLPADAGTPARTSRLHSAQLQQPRSADPQVTDLHPRSSLGCGRSQVSARRPELHQAGLAGGGQTRHFLGVAPGDLQGEHRPAVQVGRCRLDRQHRRARLGSPPSSPRRSSRTTRTRPGPPAPSRGDGLSVGPGLD